jgi:septum site-determining protein MinD
MRELCAQLQEQYDYVILDCPAGIEQGFKNAVAGADRAIVVTTPEVSAVRDADKIIGMLSAYGVADHKLVVNRVRVDMVKRGDMISLEDIIDILGIKLIGVVPDDESIIVSTNRGEPVICNEKTLPAKAYINIAKRVTGEDVPLSDLEANGGFFQKMKKLFSR